MEVSFLKVTCREDFTATILKVVTRSRNLRWIFEVVFVEWSVTHVDTGDENDEKDLSDYNQGLFGSP